MLPSIWYAACMVVPRSSHIYVKDTRICVCECGFCFVFSYIIYFLSIASFILAYAVCCGCCMFAKRKNGIFFCFILVFVFLLHFYNSCIFHTAELNFDFMCGIQTFFSLRRCKNVEKENARNNIEHMPKNE